MTESVPAVCCRQVTLSSPEISSSDSSNGRDSSKDEPASTSRRRKQKRSCGVCGDRAKSLHFGGLSCDSCKAFFRRSVQNDAYKNFQCPYEGKCVISISSRKSCQQCRFQKCLSIGMEKSWVMTEKERQQMHKARLEKKQRMEMEEEERMKNLSKRRGPANYEAKTVDLQKYLTTKEQQDIEYIIHKYIEAYLFISRTSRQSMQKEKAKNVELISMFTTIIQRLAYFVRLLPEFTSLSVVDQNILLKNGMLEMCLIRSAFVFDVKNNSWPGTTANIFKDSATVHAADIRRLVSKDLYEKHMKFIHSMKSLNPDEPTIMILLLIVLFNAERQGLENESHITALQDYYLQLLRKYMSWKYHPDNATVLFPKLLFKLTDLRELNDSHIAYNLNIAQKDMQLIQHQLGKLDISLYSSWQESEKASEGSPQAHYQDMNPDPVYHQSDYYVPDYHHHLQESSSQCATTTEVFSSLKSVNRRSSHLDDVGPSHPREEEPRGAVETGREDVHLGLNVSQFHPYETQGNFSSFLGYGVNPLYFPTPSVFCPPTQPGTSHLSTFSSAHETLEPSQHHRRTDLNDETTYPPENPASSTLASSSGFHRIQDHYMDQGYLWYGVETDHSDHLSQYTTPSHIPSSYTMATSPVATVTSSNVYNQFHSAPSPHNSENSPHHITESTGEAASGERNTSGDSGLQMDQFKLMLPSEEPEEMEHMKHIQNLDIVPQLQPKIHQLGNHGEYPVTNFISDYQDHQQPQYDSHLGLATEVSAARSLERQQINQTDHISRPPSGPTNLTSSCVDTQESNSSAYGSMSSTELPATNFSYN